MGANPTPDPRRSPLAGGLRARTRRAWLPLCLALCGCAGAPAVRGEEAAQQEARTPVEIRRELVAMGTHLVVRVWAPDRHTALRASEAAVRAVESVEARLSTWREGSELSQLNRSAPGESHRLSPELAAELGRALEIGRALDGAFDPTLGSLVRAWGLREGGRCPAAEELERARAASGLGGIVLEGGAARRVRPGLLVEEGGFGKGVGVDAGLAAARAAGASFALLDLGGQWGMAGAPPTAAEPHRFGVAHPDERTRVILELGILRGSVATSGSSERGIVVDGVRRSHILDPRTGQPARDFGSLTVWAEDGVTADALSTGLFVLGPDRALEWVERTPGVEVIVVERVTEDSPAAQGLRVRRSSGWEHVHEVDSDDRAAVPRRLVPADASPGARRKPARVPARTGPAIAPNPDHSASHPAAPGFDSTPRFQSTTSP